MTWQVFSQTGNIETYLLMKELENENEMTVIKSQTQYRQTPLSD
nr:YqzL family protein [Lentibacillus sp. JNUCC-1]